MVDFRIMLTVSEGRGTGTSPNRSSTFIIHHSNQNEGISMLRRFGRWFKFYGLLSLSMWILMRLLHRCLHVTIIFYLLISTGCSESAVPEDSVLLINIRLRCPYSETHTAFCHKRPYYYRVFPCLNRAIVSRSANSALA